MGLNKDFFAGADVAEVLQHDAVDWLIKYVEDNNENCDGVTWADWDSAANIISVYEPATWPNGEIGNYDPRPDLNTDEVMTRLEVCERGRQILDQLVQGADDNDELAEDLMLEWADEIWERGSQALRS